MMIVWKDLRIDLRLGTDFFDLAVSDIVLPVSAATSSFIADMSVLSPSFAFAEICIDILYLQSWSVLRRY